MALIRWEPVRELQTIQQEMNRLFGAAFEAQAGGGSSAGARSWMPAMDLVEKDDHFVLRADLPGVAREAVNIEVQDDVLTISGERKAEREDRSGGYHRIERAWGTFSRSLTLPDGVDPDAVKASFANGVLEVTVPKPEERKPRRVEVGERDEPAVIDGSTA
jgi:HSP20 family protein